MPAGSASDADVWCATVLWARRNGVLLGGLRVGAVEASLSDPAAVVRVGQVATPESLLEEYGGKTLADAVTGMTGGDDGDDE